MSLSLFDLTVATYKQVIPATLGILDKGAAFAHSADIKLDDLVQARLHPDMAPLHFQIVSVFHHSIGALRGIVGGEFGPPNGYADMDYAGLKEFLEQAIAKLDGFSEAQLNGCAGGQVVFKIGGQEIPFTTENFLLCFSLPNFYFHATTAYDILRAQGVPLGKRDFLGAMRIGT